MKPSEWTFKYLQFAQEKLSCISQVISSSLSIPQALCTAGKAASKQCCSLSSSQSFLYITRALGPVWSFPQDPAGADVFFKQSQQRDFSLHALWWCLTLLCILQTKCCALCQRGVTWEKLELQSFSSVCNSISLTESSLPLGLSHWWFHGSRQEQTPGKSTSPLTPG